MRALLGLVVAVAWLSSVPLLGAAAQDTTPTAVTRTDVRYFIPFTPDGLNPGLTVTGTDSGRCDAPSVADPARPDAWSCFSTGVLDPCFENPFAALDEPGELACAASPFTAEVVLFTLTEPLEREKDDVPASDDDQQQPAGNGGGADAADVPGLDAADLIELPWAIELATGEQCDLETGATAVFAGMRLNYACTGGGWVLGDVDVFQQVWTATYLPDGGFATELVEVAVGWY